MRIEGFSGAPPITLREIDLYLGYYPVEDQYAFIDLMREIDRQVRRGARNRSKG